jgi:hypothetical protein
MMKIIRIYYLGDDIPKNYTGVVEYHNGDKEWYLNGKKHRDDGPAVELKNGGKHWHLNGQRHRIDGPAIEYANGYKSWYLNGTKYSQEEWFEMLSEENKLEMIWNLR